MANRLSAPRTEIPVLANDPGFAGRTLMLAALYLPWFLDLASTPRAILHKRHQWLLATLVCTSRNVTFVRILPIRFQLEAGPITPGTIFPVEFHATLTPRAMSWHSTDGISRGIINTAPGT